MKKITSSNAFKQKHYDNLSSNLNWQNTPIQLYALQNISSFLKLPTPLIKVDYNFIIFLTEGSLSEQIGTEKLIIQAPAIVFVKAGTIIAIDKIKQHLSGYFLLIENHIMSHIITANKSLSLMNAQVIVKLDEFNKNYLSSVYELLQIEMNCQNINYDMAYSLIQVILNKYLQLSESINVQSRTEQIAFQFKQMVFEYFVQHKSPLYYAQALNISANYLNRCVKTVFNKSAKELILEIIILQGQLQLWSQEKSVAEICYELNFDDPSYFSRLFKKVTGITPTLYQNSLLNNTI